MNTTKETRDRLTIGTPLSVEEIEGIWRDLSRLAEIEAARGGLDPASRAGFEAAECTGALATIRDTLLTLDDALRATTAELERVKAERDRWRTAAGMMEA